jgi:hypothetical protein
MLQLIYNGSATGTAMMWRGGIGTFTVVGTFGGATVKLQFLGPDDTTWVDVGADATYTANGTINVTLASGMVRANVAGGTPSNIYATLEPITYDVNNR